MKFLISLAFFLGIVFAVCFDPKANDNHFLAIIQTKHQLLETTPSPKVVLVGGSNLSYGIDSKLLEHEIHEPVVNMGLSASLGLKYMVNEVLPYLHKGDRCVVVPEYEHFYSEPDGQQGTLLTLTRVYPRAISYLDGTQRVALLKGYLDIFKHRLIQHYNANDYPGYARTSFNDRGDMIFHINRQRPTWSRFHLLENCGPFNQCALDTLVGFDKACKTRGCELIIAFPNVPSELYKDHKQEIAQVYEKLSQSGLTVVGRPSDATMPLVAFWDSAYHICAQYRSGRCRTIAEQLCQKTCQHDCVCDGPGLQDTRAVANTANTY